jgi:hypothetical protein
MAFPAEEGITHMRKTLSLLAVAACTALLGLVSASPASALGGESLGCFVTPNTRQSYSTWCTNRVPSSSYGVDFRVLNRTGTYSYAWNVPAEWAGYVSPGCTSTSADCWITVPASTDSQVITVSVQLTQGGSSLTLTATADIEPWCNGQPC